MKMSNEQAGVKSKKLPHIAFRPAANDPLAEEFWRLVKELGVNGSALARRSVFEGLEIAANKILKEKAEEGSRIKRTFRRGISLSLSSQSTCGGEWMSPFLMPVT